MRLRLLVPIVGMVSTSLLVFACGGGEIDDDDGDRGPQAGSGGETSTPGPSGGGAGGQEAGSAGGACATDGSGTVVIEVTGLPEGVAPDISIAGPDMLNATEEGALEGVAAGDYTVTAARVFDEDPLVRTVYEPTVETKPFCLADGASQTIEVSYAAIPSSNKLWMTTGKDDELAGFSSADIAESGMLDPPVSIDTVAGVSIAFDRDGNLWAVNGIADDQGMIVRIPADELGESGMAEPDITITVPEIECFLHTHAIAFDSGGNLWLSACDDRILRLAAEDLTTSGDKVADVLLTEVVNNEGIAFDKDGNLWVGGGPTLLRFDAARLETSDTDPADLQLTINPSLGPVATVLAPEFIAFDKAGNLWGIAGGNVIEVSAANLAATGTKTIKADVSFPIDVGALSGTPAFDESNGLWIDLGEGQFGRFSAEQLGVSKAPGSPPVVPELSISSAGVTSTLPIAVFPAPEGLPLYHALP
jgi:hypothetical protein